MRFIVYVIGAPLAVICLMLFGALRVLAWLMALACGLCLILALFTLRNPAATWHALGIAGLMFAGAVLIHAIPMPFSRAGARGPDRV